MTESIQFRECLIIPMESCVLQPLEGLSIANQYFCFHLYGSFPCIWKFFMYMEVFHVYGSFSCIWSLSMYMEVLHPCIWKFSMYIESISMYMEEIFLLFQDGVSRVWNDLPSARMSCFFLLQEI